MTPYSYHVFLFPFRWKTPGKKSNDSFSARTNLDVIVNEVENDSKWKKASGFFDPDYQFEDYNEFTYFYDYVREALYDLPQNLRTEIVQSHNLIRHFSLAALSSKDSIGTYSIHRENGEQYDLELTDVLLNLYTTGAGIISFHLQNTKSKDKSRILAINDFGRRLYPQFLGGESNGLSVPQETFLASRIEIKIGNEIICNERFKHYSGTAKELLDNASEESSAGNIAIQPLKLPEHIMKLFPSSFLDKENIKYAMEDQDSPKVILKPVLDDRMFTVCWYGNKKMAKSLKSEERQKNNEFWYRFLFIDGTSKGADYLPFENSLLREHTYNRWRNSKTLYGVSRYSFVCLSDRSAFAMNVTATHMRTIYYRMVELALAQRASVLRFADEVTHLSYLDPQKDKQIPVQVRELYRSYIRFVNKIYFREVTAQEQGIDLYEMLQNQMRLPAQVKELDDEIGELHQFVTMLEQERQTTEANLLTKVAAIFLPPTLIAGIFGFSNIKNVAFSNILDFQGWQWEDIVFPFGLMIASSIIAFSLIKKLNNGK